MAPTECYTPFEIEIFQIRFAGITWYVLEWNFAVLQSGWWESAQIVEPVIFYHLVIAVESDGWMSNKMQQFSENWLKIISFTSFENAKREQNCYNFSICCLDFRAMEI